LRYASFRLLFALPGIFWNAEPLGGVTVVDDMSISPTIIEETVRMHAAALTLYARQFFKGGNFHAAEEIVQDVFHRLSRQAQLPENHVAWLYTAVRNAAISAARSDKRREKRETAHQPPLFKPDAESPVDAEKIALCLEKLDRTEREIVTLRLWSDLPFSDIATLLGLPKTTVFRRYETALETLRGLLEEP
jgi:RNA polymerase sigma-70 factor (ECF subfamily)